jgi:hypothetical protein
MEGCGNIRLFSGGCRQKVLHGFIPSRRKPHNQSDRDQHIKFRTNLPGYHCSRLHGAGLAQLIRIPNLPYIRRVGFDCSGVHGSHGVLA